MMFGVVMRTARLLESNGGSLLKCGLCHGEWSPVGQSQEWHDLDVRREACCDVYLTRLDVVEGFLAD